MEFGLVKTGLRAFQIFCCIIATAMVGNVLASNINGASSATAALNFSIFALVVAWLASLYGMMTRLKAGLEVPMATIVLDSFTVLFTFIAAVVLSSKLRAVNCGNLDYDDLPSDYIVWGSNNDEKRCREIQTGSVFLWFLFFSFCATLFFVVKDSRKNFGGSTLSRPTMSQLRV